MQIIEIPFRQITEATQFEQRIEQACAEFWLFITLKTSLKQYAGSVHWHIKNGKATGVLEVTLWAAEQKAWFSVHENRVADWIEPMIQTLLHRLVSSP